MMRSVIPATLMLLSTTAVSSYVVEHMDLLRHDSVVDKIAEETENVQRDLQEIEEEMISVIQGLIGGGSDTDDRVNTGHILSDEFISEVQLKSEGMWKAGRNFHADMSETALKGMMGTILDDSESAVRLSKFDEDEDEAVVYIPTSFDARLHWPNCPSIAEIRDQGSCGSCWAIAGVSAMTDRLCTTRNETKNRLSTEDLLTCCTSCGFGCSGGFPGAAWAYWQQSGIVTGGAYHMSTDGWDDNPLCKSYLIPPCEHHTSGKRIKCSEIGKTPRCVHQCDDSSLSYSGSKIFAKKSYSLPRNVDTIQREVMLRGPVEASFTVFEDFVHYKSGVYRHVTGNPLGGHAVRLLGWGEEEGVPYWLVANSWNYDWGDNGLFKILRGEDHCGFESAIVAGF